ncbi:TPA_asm: hypothetical protein G1W56_23455 [Salmonella enterica subsp. enterica serovar Typhimurium str. SL1344]|uniref:Head-tail joining protein n=1 Tax=Salmonella typhimurium (strain SL1344) TaxID=216597 RepID=A0A718K857_SALTS|nr:hypothetical protein [Salmonella enterica subsp. enterica serovar Typhimurium str. SL1344]HAD6533663.1 hypothetical protein [Salmonella enterica subsp. enterica serovar Typhimurium str. SL1344]HAD6538549.1 hypothetical protein [Salmonella enterica subsp. enterica serovar Typhimurium str. SL1344]HAD6557303.1 hypothetical protein [Salmonella enterica subsp. enterica serovar Typhimurium str. SL1344]HAD6652857.1 hypothetical protein [Salmonella enterica subsp. enterica serovar Typhimurium str. S
MADNYVVREQYKGVVEANGQLILMREEANPGALIETQPVAEEPHYNGGGEPKQRRRRKSVEE